MAYTLFFEHIDLNVLLKSCIRRPIAGNLAAALRYTLSLSFMVDYYSSLSKKFGFFSCYKLSGITVLDFYRLPIINFLIAIKGKNGDYPRPLFDYATWSKYQVKTIKTPTFINK